MTTFAWNKALDAYQITAEVEAGTFDTVEETVILFAQSMESAVYLANDYLGITGSIKRVERIGRAIIPSPMAVKEGQA